MLSLVIRRNKEEKKGIEIEILYYNICVSDIELSIEIEIEIEIEFIGANYKLSSKLDNNLCNKADVENKD